MPIASLFACLWISASTHKQEHELFKRSTSSRQIWRVAGRESGSPELLKSPRTSPEVSQTSPEVSQTSPEVLSLWNSTAIQSFPGSFPDFPGSSPDFPGSFPDFPGGPPLSLGSLTPSPHSQKLSFNLTSFPTTPTPSTFSKVLLYKWEAYSRTDGRRIAAQMGGVLLGFPVLNRAHA